MHFPSSSKTADRTWMVVASEQRTIKLPEGLNLVEWAPVQWPAPRPTVELHRWQYVSGWPR